MGKTSREPTWGKPPKDNYIQIGLSSWIIQDGNYPDFRVNEERAFAVEFYTSEPVRPRQAGQPRLGELVVPAQYRALARVVLCDEDVAVLDFGFLAYREQWTHSQAAATLVEGEFYLGVDPYFYFEYLHARSGIPALIYTWRIRRILIDTAPLVEVERPGDGRCRVRDPAQRGTRDIPATDAWHDDDGNASYTLVCERLPAAPRRSL
jgi:hypothetical protein